MIIDAKTNKVGKLVSGDGATFHKVSFKALTFYPKLQEIVEGEIVEITDFGAFVRIGPTDALLHLSQITDDYLKSDVKQGVIVANQSARSLKIGSKLRARVTAISLGKGSAMQTNKVKLDQDLNRHIWSRGKTNPPRKIRLRMIKEDDDTVIVSSFIEEKAPQPEPEESVTEESIVTTESKDSQKE